MMTDNALTPEQQLFQYYLRLKMPIPEGGAEWNLSPEYHYLFGFAVRDFLQRLCTPFPGIRVCNVGIGNGDWDDFLGYWLHGWGTLTSVDIDSQICAVFAYRQQRECHLNPSSVVNESIFRVTLPPASFDVLTIIGSTPQETGNPPVALDCSFDLVKPGGHLLFMGVTSIAPAEWLNKYLHLHTQFRVVEQQTFDYYPKMVGYAYWVEKLKS